MSPLDGGTAPVDGGTGPLAFATEPVPATTMVTGIVTSASSGTPLFGVSVQIGTGAPTSTDRLGQFQLLEVPSGQATISFRAAGYLAVDQLVAIIPDTTEIHVALLPQAAAQDVSSTGATIAAGDAQVVIPPNAYAAVTPVAVTWIGDANAGSVSGPAQFYDSGDAMRESVGMVDLDAPTQPLMPVTVRIPTTAVMGEIGLYELGADGQWTGRVEPTSVEGGVATFEIDHFSLHGAFRDRPAPSYRVLYTSGSGAATWTDTSGASYPVTAGVSLPIGARLSITTTPGYVALQSPDGGRLTVREGTVVFGLDADGPIVLVQGRAVVNVSMRAGAPMPRTWRYRLRARSRPAVMGVRGTAFSFAAEQCGSRMIDTITVVEGSVDVTTAAGTEALGAGQALRACENCPDPTRPECCGAPTTACSTGDDCCSYDCTSGRCGCLQPGSGATCRTDAECCSGICAATSPSEPRRCYLPIGATHDGFYNQCYGNSDGLRCTCYDEGRLCRSSTDCCSQYCDRGVCQLAPPGTPCTLGSQHCLSDTCSDPYTEPYLCETSYPGGLCRTNADCTSGICTPQGVCMCDTTAGRDPSTTYCCDIDINVYPNVCKGCSSQRCLLGITECCDNRSCVPLDGDPIGFGWCLPPA